MPEGLGRLELLDALAQRFGVSWEPFVFTSKVPVPQTPSPELTLALIQDIARHHQARVHSVAPDHQHFYLLHRAGRLLGADRRWLASVVHDNTIAGGERVAEVVTAPLSGADVGWLADLIAFLGSIEGIELPEGAALHVHVDGRAFLSPPAIASLAVAYAAWEPALRVVLRTSSAMRRAGALPPALVAELTRAASADEVLAAIRRHVPSRSFGLNLYNLAAGDPDKLTVELKLASATVDPGRVLAIRALALALARWGIEGRGAPSPAAVSVDGMLEALGLSAEAQAALRS